MGAKTILLTLLSGLAIYAVLIVSLMKTVPLDSRDSFDLAVVCNINIVELFAGQ
jgi:hypothetical protein